MKKTKFALMAAILGLSVSTSSYAGGIWDLVKNSHSDGKIETKQYTIEVAGTNIRGYVYDVPEMASICISVWGEHSSSHQLECKTYDEIQKAQKSK